MSYGKILSTPVKDLICNKYEYWWFNKYYENNDIFRLLLDKKYEIFEKLIDWEKQLTELSMQIKFFKNRQSNYIYFVNQTENTLKTLSEICKINIGGTPRRDNPDYWISGNNIWVSIRELNDNIITDSTEKITDLGVKESNVKLIPKDTILFSFKLSIGKIAISGCDLYTNEAIAGLIIQENHVIMKYLYYILKEINTFSLKGCIGKGSLNKESLSKIKIPVPSLKRQKEIIEYCENNDIFIKQLEKEIENNKKQAQQFITDILKSQDKLIAED
jgi:restriction endonuclease S subunit